MTTEFDSRINRLNSSNRQKPAPLTLGETGLSKQILSEIGQGLTVSKVPVNTDQFAKAISLRPKLTFPEFGRDGISFLLAQKAADAPSVVTKHLTSQNCLGVYVDNEGRGKSAYYVILKDNKIQITNSSAQTTVSNYQSKLLNNETNYFFKDSGGISHTLVAGEKARLDGGDLSELPLKNSRRTV